MDLKDSQPAKNLAFAFAGESQARNKYTYFASVAKKEGYEQIAAIFLETAENEKEHAKLWFKHLEGIGDTVANLKAAAAGENEEWTEMYKGFAETARQGASMPSHASSRVSPPSRSTTRSVTAHCSRPSMKAPPTSRSERSCGSAATAVPSSPARRPRSSAPSASTPRHTSSSSRATTTNLKVRGER